MALRADSFANSRIAFKFEACSGAVARAESSVSFSSFRGLSECLTTAGEARGSEAGSPLAFFPLWCFAEPGNRGTFVLRAPLHPLHQLTHVVLNRNVFRITLTRKRLIGERRHPLIH